MTEITEIKFMYVIYSICACVQLQVTFIYIALFTIQIVSKQLYSVKQENSVSIMQEDNSKHSIFQLKSVHCWFSNIIQLSSVLFK